MQMFCRCSKFSQYVLAKVAKATKMHAYDLTRKGRPFVWGKEQSKIHLIEIKCRLITLPVLHMPNKTGRFYLYLDTSKFATSSALYQIQNGKPKLIAYAS